MAMKRQGTILVMVAAVLATLAGVVAAPVQAGPPQPAKGRGEKCVEPTDWMRRNHMTILKHQRDDTVHLGIRTEKHSLKGCIDCHQVKGTDGAAVTVADPKHFCRTCHDYAAVKVDCFECHASRPGEAAIKGAMHGVPPGSHVASRGDVASLSRYLEGAGR